MHGVSGLVTLVGIYWLITTPSLTQPSPSLSRECYDPGALELSISFSQM